MSKVAVMISQDRIDAPISGHFGKAQWAMVADTSCHAVAFLRNDGSNGSSAAQLIAETGCTDVIFTSIGNGALSHLQAASIRGWVAPPEITGKQALEMFEHLRLQPAATATEGHAGGGCCCSHSTKSGAHACCNG